MKMKARRDTTVMKIWASERVGVPADEDAEEMVEIWVGDPVGVEMEEVGTDMVEARDIDVGVRSVEDEKEDVEV